MNLSEEVYGLSYLNVSFFCFTKALCLSNICKNVVIIFEINDALCHHVISLGTQHAA